MPRQAAKGRNKDEIKAKYCAEKSEETGPTLLYHDDCPEGRVFERAAVSEAIDNGWWNDV